MIVHPTKSIQLKPNSDNWGFPGAEPMAPRPGSNETLLPPGQHAIPKDGVTPTPQVDETKAQATNPCYSLHDLRPDEERSAEFYSTNLPSGFHFYDFKELSVRKVTGRVQAKFSRAGADGNPRHLIEGISALLGNGVSAYDLSSEDFRWLMHFILLLSYPQSPRKIVVTCDGEKHNALVEAGEMDKSTLSQVHNFDRPTLKEFYFEPSKLAELDLTPLSAYTLGIYTMRDSVDFEEMFAGQEPTEEDIFIYDLAAYLKGGTLEERADKVRDMSVPEFRALEAYRAVAQQHGIISTIKSTCKECGTETVTDVTISVHDFLKVL